jgi:UDP-N-acetyl-D-mannosaminuronic acid dehydrogenase
VTLESLFHKRGPIKRIGVVGMGYVGIPSAALFAASPKFDFVYGFQRKSPSSGHKIDALNRGESPMKGEEPGLSDLLTQVVSLKKFSCTSDFSKIMDLDAVTIAIQTPFLNNDDLLPDFSALNEGISKVGRYTSPGTLIVLESTVTPGTTEGFVRGILEQESGLAAGIDFGLAHAPERVMAGRLIRNIREHDRIVGGIDEASTQRAMELYAPVLTTGTIIPMTARAAEVTKTAENTFRDLQIAAINELALYCEAMGVNVYDVRSGIDSLKGEGITRARKINDFMPRHMFNLTVDALERVHCTTNAVNVAILGWAFLADSDDTRNTPSERYRDLFLKAGASVRVHDPYVTGDPAVAVSHDFEDVISNADAIAIFTAHRHYRNLDPVKIHRLAGKAHPVIVDGRNVIDPDEFISRGFVYRGIGRGDKNSHAIVKV